MHQIIKKQLNGGIDADSAEHLVPPNCFISGQNVRIGGTTDLGGVGYIESILENAEQFHILPSGGSNTTIGFAKDDENGWIVKFNYNSNGDHGIYLFNLYLETWYDLLLNADVTGGLGFEKNEIIHSARIENGVLYWVNSTTAEPRKLNIKSAVNLYTPGVYPDNYAYTSPISQNTLYWIRKQPSLPIEITKIEDTGLDNNFIKDEGFWFAWRYIYRDYEISTLSAWSELANYNSTGQAFNSITLEFPLGEFIEQDVLQVDAVVRYANSGKSFVIKSWNKNVPIDAADIIAHNNGSNNLDFNYANDYLGIALDDAYSVKPYDSLPIYAQTIEIARNRAFMLNYTLGYDTPTETSLVVAANVETDSATPTARWVSITYDGGGQVHYFLDVQGLASDNGFYDYTPQPPGFPATVAFGSMTFVAGGPASFALYIVANYTMPWIGGIVYTGDTSEITGSPPVAGLSGSEALKSGATYQTSIHFLDHAGRKCGILTADDLKIEVSDREYDQVDYTTGITWALSNANAVDEIPLWASYYSINVTKCLTTRFFLQARVRNITYATKDADDAYVFNTDAYSADLNGVAIDTTSLNSFGMGYVFAEGDLVNVYIDGDPTVYRLSIVAQEGKWIICELQNLGTLGNLAGAKTDVLFQPFTPYRPSVSEPHYEVAQIYSITNAGTALREYSTIAGQTGGDITLLTRNDGSADYLTENMSPNDKFYTRWNTDSGRPNFLDDIGQETRTNEIPYSNVLIEGSKTNGLSTFEALNTKTIPVECGDGIKLQVADKISEQGSIMLALCVNETVSLYLGEAQLLGSTGNAFLAQAADVIGTVNVLQGSYGTMNPESVVLLRGRVFFYCLIKGCFVSYSNNGLFPVSDYGLKRVSHLFSQAYAALTVDEIEALGSRPFVFGGVDPYHMEVYWSIPATTSTPPKGYLEDYISPDLPVIYPYDIYDGRAKVLVYKPNFDRWTAPHSYQTEGFVDIRDFLFSAKNGAMYQHNNNNGTDDTYNKWYGESVKPAIGFIINEEVNIVKQYLTLSVEGNGIEPTWVHHRCELPNIQSTDNTEWNNREGVLYEKYGILRDRLSPNVTGSFDQKLYTGDKMMGQWLKVYVEFTTNQLLQIRFFNVGASTDPGGQKT
jgi:hypothetical protein